MQDIISEVVAHSEKYNHSKMHSLYALCLIIQNVFWNLLRYLGLNKLFISRWSITNRIEIQCLS